MVSQDVINGKGKQRRIGDILSSVNQGSCQEVCKGKSGGSLPRRFLHSDAVDVLHPMSDLCQQPWSIQATGPLPGDQQPLLDHRFFVLHPLELLRRVSPQTEGGEGRFHRGGAGAQMHPVRFRELIEPEHPLRVSVQNMGSLLEPLRPAPLLVCGLVSFRILLRGPLGNTAAAGDSRTAAAVPGHGPTDRDRAGTQGQTSGLAVPAAVTRGASTAFRRVDLLRPSSSSSSAPSNLWIQALILIPS